MARKKRIQRTKLQMLASCETHLHFLEDALYAYAEEKERYKQIAAELRVLVCTASKNDPLLLNLMDEYGFSYDIQPPRAPFDKRPIPLVGDSDDPDREVLTTEFASALGDEEKLARALEKQAALRRSVPFSEFVNRGLAVLSQGYEYSYNELTLAIAQQMGSSHEAEYVESRILELQKWIIDGHEGHVMPLINFAELIIQVGLSFLGFLVKEHGYEAKFFQSTV